MNAQPLTPNARPSVQLHIERMVVDEALLSGGQSAALQAAVETELARLLAERGLTPLADTSIPALVGRNIQVVGQVRPAQLGQQIAQAVHTTIEAANQSLSKGQPN